MLHYMCWSLSPDSVKKKKKRRRDAWAIKKKIWTHEGPSIEKKKKMWAHEGP